MFKDSKNLAPPQMHEIFKLKEQSNYNLKYNSLFTRALVTSANKGTERLSFLGPKIWDNLPDTYKGLAALNSFKVALEKWIPFNCPFRICKVYIPNVAFI